MIECRPADTIRPGDRILTGEGWFARAVRVTRYPGGPVIGTVGGSGLIVHDHDIVTVKL